MSKWKGKYAIIGMAVQRDSFDGEYTLLKFENLLLIVKIRKIKKTYPFGYEVRGDSVYPEKISDCYGVAPFDKLYESLAEALLGI